MKVCVAIIFACLAVAIYAQNPADAAQDPSAGGASSMPMLGAGTNSFFGLAALTGGLGDNMQVMLQCQMMGIPYIACLGMQM